MKKPYITQERREALKYPGTLRASILEYHIAERKFLREIKRNKGCIAAYKAERAMAKALSNSWIFKGWTK